MVIADIIEQNAIFDGLPKFAEPAMVINLVNHHSYGGTPAVMREAIAEPSMQDPRRYKVRVTIEYEQISEDAP